MIQVSTHAPASNFAPTTRKIEKTDLSATNFVTSTLQADAAIKSAILKLLSDNPKLQSSFEAGFFAEMRKAENMDLQITNENGMHNALISVIMQNRSQFPGGSFTIKTELPGGGSIETIIPVGKKFRLYGQIAELRR